MATAAAILSGQYDDGLTTFYNVELGSSPGHVQHNGIGRTGVRLDASASAIGMSIKSILVRFRKYGSPAGNITLGIRKAADDSLVTIGTWPIEYFPANVEQSIISRLRSNSYNMVLNDAVNVEFPSNATNGFETVTSTTEGNPANHTSRSHNGSTWSNTANPVSITFKE